LTGVPLLPLIPESGFPRVLALEVASLVAAALAALPFAVWRYGRSAWPLVALLAVLALMLIALGGARAAWRVRRRLPKIELRARPREARLKGAIPAALAALGCALVWSAAGLLPREVVAAAGLAPPLEALALLGACLLAPVLRARARRFGDAVAFGLIASLGGALAWALSEQAGPVAWVVLGALALWRGWSLSRERREEPGNEQERWLLALGAVVAAYWLATLARAFVPLPGAGWLAPMRGGAAAPEPWLLLWGLAHFTLLALAQARGWPAPRAEHEPPPPPRAFARGRAGPK